MKIVAIDFETFNRKPESACSVGIAVIEGNEITKTYGRLIRPPENELEPIFHFGTHSISWDDVKAEPNFKEIWDDVGLDFLDANFAIAHNAGSDKSILMGCCKFYGIVPPRLHFLCSKKISSELWGTKNAELESVCQFLNIDHRPHVAESDAEGSARILLHAIEQGYNLLEENDYSDKKYLSEELMGFTEKIIEDGVVEDTDIQLAWQWLNTHPDNSLVYPGNRLKEILNQILQDGVVSDTEKKEFYDILCRLHGKKQRKKYATAKGKREVLFTGVGKAKKAEYKSEAEAAGFYVPRRVTKNLTYLVCGLNAGDQKIRDAKAVRATITTPEKWKAIVSTVANS
ncbi:MAG: exonuclease domain-containing protein [Pirellulales bacterium]